MGRVFQTVLAGLMLTCSACTEPAEPDPKPLPESVHAYRMQLRVRVCATTEVRKISCSARFVKPDPEVCYPLRRVMPQSDMRYVVLKPAEGE